VLRAVGPRVGTRWTCSPSTLGPDAALGLLLRLRDAWCHLLFLGVGNRAPSWTHLLNK
jgi:hypothetical protein